jgi:transcriptional regulator with XRE-family HTH domain
MQLADKLKDLREEHGYMQKDVSQMLGIAPNTLSGYERGLRKPDSNTLLSIAKFYNVTVDYLLNDNIFDETFEEEFKWDELCEQIRSLNKTEQRKIYKIVSILIGK